MIVRIELKKNQKPTDEQIKAIRKAKTLKPVEERNATSMGKLTADVDQIRLFNKKVLGAIVL